MQTPSDRTGLPRRGVLRALALAPAALAGCAAGRAAGGAADGAAAGATREAAPTPVRPPAPGALAAIRGFRLPADAEPASVFRAAAARAGEP